MAGTRSKRVIAIFGGGDSSRDVLDCAERLGRAVAQDEQILLTGGTSPNCDSVKNCAIGGAGPAPWVGINRKAPVLARRSRDTERGLIIDSDLGYKRNCLAACMCDAAIALPGEEGTLSEVTCALSFGRPVAFVGDWRADCDLEAGDPSLVLDRMVERAGALFAGARASAALDALLRPEALRRRLDRLPAYIYRSLTSAEEAVDWIREILAQPGEFQGKFPEVERHEQAALEYGTWLANEAEASRGPEVGAQGRPVRRPASAAGTAETTPNESQKLREPNEDDQGGAKPEDHGDGEEYSFESSSPGAEMKILRKPTKRTLEESLDKLREHVKSAKPPRQDRPGCGKAEENEGSGKPQSEPRKDASKAEDDSNGATDKPEDGGAEACSLPVFEGGAHDVVKFHQRLVALELAELENITIACAAVSVARLNLGFLQRYQQEWEYRRTTVGRPVSYVSLAPLERRRVQVAQKRKTSLSRSDRTKRSSRRTYESASSTKASTSATNSSTSRNKWSVSASGSYGVRGVGWGATVDGSLEASAEQSRQMAMENIVEETEKSSTEVLAETETTTTIGLQTSFEHIEDHQLVNPYADRTVLLSLLELVDEFCVRTSTAGIAPCLVVDFDPISSSSQRVGPSVKFDDAFVSTHRQFLRTALLDDALIEFLDSQLALETQAPNTGEVAQNARRCLYFLFNATGVFAPETEPAYDIEASFDPAGEGDSLWAPGTGFYDAVANDLTDIYLLMASVRFMYRRDGAAVAAGNLARAEFLRRATEYVIVLHRGLAGWAAVDPDLKRKLHDTSNKTEMFRRITAFVELAEQLVVGPLRSQAPQPPSGVDAADQAAGDGEEPAPAAPPTTGAVDGPRTAGVARVVNHLNCFGRYYTEEYLQFLHEWTGVAAVVELLASLDTVHRSLIDFLDFERSFVDGTTWIVPFAEVISAQAAAEAFLPGGANLSTLSPIATEIAVRMPASGVHVEAVPGQCNLPGLPVPSSEWPPPSAAYLGTNPWMVGSDDFQ